MYVNEVQNRDDNTGGKVKSPTDTLPIVVYALGATLLVIGVVFLVFFVLRRKSKLNWYEKNLLEISKAETEVIRYCKNDRKGGDECDSEYGANKLTSTTWRQTDSIDSVEIEKQPRIYRSLPELDAESINLTNISYFHACDEDVSDKFVVPTHRTSSLSMFRGFDTSKFDKEMYDSRQDSVPTEEQVLGQCGSLQMALSFDTNLNLLTVKLVQGTDLLARRTDSPPNPYFKVHLVQPDAASHQQIYQTKVYKNCRSAELDEEFCFDIPSGTLTNCKLEVTVHDFDQYTVDECIGCCWISLNRLEISNDSSAKTIFWAEILPYEQLDEDSVGDLSLSIAYLTKAQRLIVTVLKARNLVGPDDMTPPDPFIKIALMLNRKKLRHRRTSAKKSCYNPTFNEALTFDIPKNSLYAIVLSISVCHETHAFRQSKVLGRMELPLNKCKDLWRSIIRGEDFKARWYPLEKCDKAG